MAGNIIHSADIPGPYLKALRAAFPEALFIAIPRSKDVYASIAAHPDIFVFDASGNGLVVSPSLPDATMQLLCKTGRRIIKASKAPSGAYPGTAALNAARVGKKVFHNLEYTDESIREVSREAGLELVDINQGYSRCSIVPVGDRALITPDNGIATAARSAGLDVLTVSPGDVLLPGEKHGFLGGASGVTAEGVVVFLGDISRHTDGSAIKVFFVRNGVKYIDMPGLPLYDAGSVIFI